MPNRRESVHNFYRPSTLLTEGIVGSANIPFRGPGIHYTVVTRTDLNGYSTWARDKTAAQRAAALDAFFSAVVPNIDRWGGVYFRDEGDCILALFSDYFQRNASFATIREYALTVSGRVYGPARLSAKTTIVGGDVAYFQKRHEEASGDWSAEGEPFVRAARLEAAITSVAQVVLYAEEYDADFAPVAIYAGPGQRGPWNLERESLQVSGVGAAGGWQDIVRLIYRP